MIEEKLAAFLAWDAKREWSPGSVVDCCLALAEWAIWLGYPDPASHLRGAYTAGDGQVDILHSSGGALALVAQCAATIDAVPLHKPSCGAIGVIGSEKCFTRQFGVIHDGAGWITRTKNGYERVVARPLAIWKI